MKGDAKILNKQKQKKIKPLKQPTKINRPPTLLDKVQKRDDHQIRLQRQKQPKNVANNNIASDQHKNNTRQGICQHLLQSGNVQSFIDLFYISHKCLPNVMEKKNYYGQKLYIPELQAQQQSTLQFYNDFANSLSKAQVRPDSSRQEKEASMNQYNSIAFNYQDQGDYITASYFYQKVIELALSCKNKQYQLVALLGLGKCHQQGKKRQQAIDILQDAFDNAITIEEQQQRSQMVKLIGKELIEIYIDKAEQLTKIDMNQALKSYQSSLNIAQRAGQLQSQARLSHKIGQLYYLQGEYQKSVEFQEQYLEKLKISSQEQLIKEQQGGQKKDNQNSLKFKQMEAHASLAKCYLKLKNIEKSEKHLNEYHRMAKEAKAQNSVADSSYYLAKLFEEKGEKQKAILYYQSYFEAAKSEKADKKQRKLVDKARVTYAIAKANKNMSKYIELFEGDNSLKNVLDWKIKRILK